MPLIAIVGGQRIESWKLSKADWTELKGSYRQSDVIMSCGQAGYTKTSPLGTQFFSHKSGSNCRVHDGGPETPQHLRAMAIIAETARDLGWTATVEYRSSDRSWIADVMIEKGGRRVAAEVQWSTQSDAEFRRRQVRYEADGVECMWFAVPANANNVAGVSSYQFSESADDLKVEIPKSFVGQEPMCQWRWACVTSWGSGFVRVSKRSSQGSNQNCHARVLGPNLRQLVESLVRSGGDDGDEVCADGRDRCVGGISTMAIDADRAASSI